MGSIVSGLLGGNTGGGFKAQSANLQTPATTEQANQQYGNVQTGIGNQAALLQALQAQHGLQNQSDVYNQLANVAAGTGPNPAQAMLANQTGANTANQAALMASQRGTSANPALIARMAAQQGAANQQNAVGQGAALQAQQSLGALGQMGNLANTQAGQQMQGTQNYTNAAQNAYGQVGQNINAQNQAQIGNVSQQNQANAAIAGQNAGAQNNLIGGLMGAAGTALAGPVGGILTNLFTKSTQAPIENHSPDAGGGSMQAVYKAEGGSIDGPRSKVGQHFHMFAQGGAVPAMVSPGERYLPPKAVEQVIEGKNPMKAGEEIPGKPKVAGAKNSYANDTVPKTLEEGGIVLPRSVTQAKDPAAAAAKFVAATLAKKTGKLK